MSSSKKISLDNFKTILFNYEPMYRESRGPDRQKVLGTIVKEIIAQSKGQLKSNDAGALKTVCWPTYINRLES